MSRVQRLCQALPKLEIVVPLREFALFPDLPPELRHQIWRFAAMVPRSIRLRRRDYRSTGDDQPGAPAILHTSRESRREGKRYYTMCRELKHIDTEQRPLDLSEDHTGHGRKHMVWINLGVDRFVWDWTILPGQPVAADLDTHFNFEGFVIKSIRYLQCEHPLRKISVFRALKIFENLLLQESTLLFKFEHKGWRRNDFYGWVNLLHFEQMNATTKRQLLKMLAQKDARWRVEFEVEIS